MAWFTSAMRTLQAVEPLAMLLQSIRSEMHHSASINQSQEIFEAEKEQAYTMHAKEMQTSNRLHKESISQAKDIYEREFATAVEMHEKETILANYLNDIGLWSSRVQHSDNKKYTLSLFQQELNHAQNVSRKENIRDTIVQESQRAQAIMIVDTLMFGCCFSVLVEGSLPVGTGETLVAAFSFTLGTALACLIFSVWFAMNLQSRIAKYVISDPNAKYGPAEGKKMTFKEYFRQFCKPVYKLTHGFMWLGTIALIINGTLLISAKFAVTHKSHTSTFVFVVVQSLCLLGLSLFLFVHTPRLRVRSGGDDYSLYEKFVSDLRRELEVTEHESLSCDECQLPVNLFMYCTKTGARHMTQHVCEKCGFNIRRHLFCPQTGEKHLGPSEPSTVHVGATMRHRHHHRTPHREQLYTPESDDVTQTDDYDAVGISEQPDQWFGRCASTGDSTPPSPAAVRASPLVGSLVPPTSIPPAYTIH
eukprot:TRINITY_DN3168_c1_g1_i2.p1 TRINITY_DN3168_c1_g1~~TRINITY_DN3168_c1_g1_i2.p1  ORF type:complete len:487 (+),score=166.62 TRINITY_DN3168_c1_g1_i2:37-1461(+)